MQVFAASDLSTDQAAGAGFTESREARRARILAAIDARHSNMPTTQVSGAMESVSVRASAATHTLPVVLRGGVSASAAPDRVVLRPRVLTPTDINFKAFIEADLPDDFDVHGDSNVGSLAQGVDSEISEFLLTLQPWMPTAYPVRLTPENRGFFKYLDHTLHNGENVMQMGVFYNEHFGKIADPVFVYLTRTYVLGETLSSDEVFIKYIHKDFSSKKDMTAFDIEINSRRMKILTTLQSDKKYCINYNHEHPELIKFWAQAGIAAAQNSLGFMYYNDLCVPQDYTEAFKWFKKAADQGDVAAQNNVGVMYYNGLGVPQDYAEAFKWHKKAADQDHAEAQYNLGALYQDGLGVTRDCAEAFKWYKKATDQGHANAKNALGLLFVSGKGAQQNISEAFDLYKQIVKSENIDPLYEFNYGVFVYFGIYTEKNPSEGLERMNLALEMGHPSVFYMFHKLHQCRLIDGANDADAAMYLSCARNGGLDDIQISWVHSILQKAKEERAYRLDFDRAYNLVVGQGVERNLHAAFCIYKKLFERSEPHSLDQFNYGVFVLLGLYTQKDKSHALDLMRASINSNHPRALYMFHKLHEKRLIDGANDNDAYEYLFNAKAYELSDCQKLWVDTLLDRVKEKDELKALAADMESIYGHQALPGIVRCLTHSSTTDKYHNVKTPP